MAAADTAVAVAAAIVVATAEAVAETTVAVATAAVVATGINQRIHPAPYIVFVIWLFRVVKCIQSRPLMRRDFF